ncbi:manganese efflux pump MntP [Moraxella nasicaprae]|uniref:Putative manganese efflux pump MntP n=1 Tax=Moraxella nasicaprae TaxID=2904122 RepID=A0ABY6F489_9GAMM|nr:manganese efflux pump MntP family protein [Moraxella nasicaprae]UXZ04906.1 manganese efflux pump MntP family protein [Moraxella nasicaprae]
MNAIALIALAFAMSMDAFAAAIVQGTHKRTVSVATALKVGATFGITEMLMPMMGYFVGRFAHAFVQAFDHWLSFILLAGIGGHLIYETIGDGGDEMPKPTSFTKTLLTAFATSIDAMIVGVSLAFLSVNIWLAGALIGLTTFLMTTLGVSVGATLGKKVGKIAQIMGGVVLIAIGVFILVTHLLNH